MLKLSVDKLEDLAADELAEELSGMYQGDIVISQEQLDEYRRSDSRKNGRFPEKYQWTNAIVPYRIDESFYSNQLSLIEQERFGNLLSF